MSVETPSTNPATEADPKKWICIHCARANNIGIWTGALWYPGKCNWCGGTMYVTKFIKPVEIEEAK